MDGGSPPSFASRSLTLPLDASLTGRWLRFVNGDRIFTETWPDTACR